jgi:ribulose-phosphate 3-epimerase
MEITPSLMARTNVEVSEQLTFLKSLYTPVISNRALRALSSCRMGLMRDPVGIEQNKIIRNTQNDKNIVLHLDIMDGQFIPSNTPMDYSQIADPEITFDVHLMASNPSALLEKLPQTKIRYVYCHAELSQNIIDQFVADCLSRNLPPGLALNPETPTNRIPFDISLPATSYKLPAILLMSVVPGDSGRAFDPNVVAKIEQIKSTHPDIFVTVDGGINRETIKEISKADCAVAHNAIFKAESPKKEFELLQSP